MTVEKSTSDQDASPDPNHAALVDKPNTTEAFMLRTAESSTSCFHCQQHANKDVENGVLDHKSSTTDANIVVWEVGDPENPRNWTFTRKIAFTATAALMIFAVSFASSIFGAATHVTAAEFNVSVEVMDLGVALFILGFAAGPCFFGPLSEVFGHVIPVSIALGGLAIFQIPVAVAQDVRTILVCRFLAGAFGSGIFAVVSGMFVELWEPITRGVALALSATCINLGSTVAPMVGAYATRYAGWRWTAWITLIYCGIIGFAGLFFIRESSSNAVLVKKAHKLKFETGNWALHTKSEESPHDLGVLIHKYMTKPVRMFVLEPILIVFTIYLTLVYGILFLSYQAFPFAFQHRGWPATSASLPFMAVVIGILSAWGVFSIFTMTWYKKRWIRRGSSIPEDRLPPMMVGAVMLPPALLWFAWSMDTHWMSQIIAAYFIGLGLLLIFIAGIVYIVDVYTVSANSAMSIHVVVRSIVASSFPLFANPMYEGLGVQWASTLLALLCVVMIPAPFIFYKYGVRIRSWSRFSMSS